MVHGSMGACMIMNIEKKKPKMYYFFLLSSSWVMYVLYILLSFLVGRGCFSFFVCDAKAKGWKMKRGWMIERMGFSFLGVFLLFVMEPCWGMLTYHGMLAHDWDAGS
jgi:hypothetical protein